MIEMGSVFEFNGTRHRCSDGHEVEYDSSLEKCPKCGWKPKQYNEEGLKRKDLLLDD